MESILKGPKEYRCSPQPELVLKMDAEKYRKRAEEKNPTMDTLIEAVFDSATAACAPIFVSRRIDSPPDEVQDNGACGFVDIGQPCS